METLNKNEEMKYKAHCYLKWISNSSLVFTNELAI